jgi:hypothetical protein
MADYASLIRPTPHPTFSFLAFLKSALIRVCQPAPVLWVSGEHVGVEAQFHRLLRAFQRRAAAPDDLLAAADFAAPEELSGQFRRVVGINPFG